MVPRRYYLLPKWPVTLGLTTDVRPIRRSDVIAKGGRHEEKATLDLILFNKHA